MGCVLKYPGAKNRIADWIISYIPEHRVYCEPFAGSLGVFFRKERCHIETVNDVDGEIVNFFRIIREHPEELKRAIELTPYSRNEYTRAFEVTDEPIEKARRFAVRCWMGYGCANARYKNGFRTGQQSNSPNPARAWAKYPETIEIAAERLRGVQIEQLPALELLKRYDTEDVFMYLDPPYLQGTRKKNLYVHEMSDVDHEELLDAVTQHPGRFLISGYDNDMYNSYLKGWNKAYKKSQIESGKSRQEVLWFNY